MVVVREPPDELVAVARHGDECDVGVLLRLDGPRAVARLRAALDGDVAEGPLRAVRPRRGDRAAGGDAPVRDEDVVVVDDRRHLVRVGLLQHLREVVDVVAADVR